MEFKGQQGKLKMAEYKDDCLILIENENEHNVASISTRNAFWEEARAYGQLFSKAPELLEEHKTDIDQLEVWIEWLKDLEEDERYIGLIEGMKKCIDIKSELIKSVIEI